ncbi:ribonuclease H-like domain-containing protein [Mycena polygramma]|nr:ribonuclease H-like domain-containing protein [Mycena polygramma]
MRDEIGLVRAIAVKERSSAKRKDLFKTIQLRRQSDPAEVAKQMVLDMKVRWSSTYAMLDRAYTLRDDVDAFVFQMAMDKSGEKRQKLSKLELQKAEWDRVNLFLDLLAYAEYSQQKFSSDLKSTLHLALPALEALHDGWTQCADDPKYSVFADALNQALAKVDEYYQKTSNSNAYMFAMVLDPSHKLSYFKKHWPGDLQDAAIENMEETFKQRYLKLRGTPTAVSAPVKKAPALKLRRSVVINDDTGDSTRAQVHVDPLKPWLDEYQQYLSAVEVVPPGMDTIQWWGINADRYPVWASLARDYLAVMSSSVSSERAFSSAGITISKRRNRLKSDIVEALQVLKCMLRKDLIFRKSSLMDESDDVEQDDNGNDEPWDVILEDDPDDYDADSEMSDVET